MAAKKTEGGMGAAILFGKARRESFRRDKCQHVIGLDVVCSKRGRKSEK